MNTLLTILATAGVASLIWFCRYDWMRQDRDWFKGRYNYWYREAHKRHIWTLPEPDIQGGADLTCEQIAKAKLFGHGIESDVS